MKYKTREQWLMAAVAKLKPLFKEIGEEVPEVRVSVGWPGGGSPRKRIGECWKPHAADDGISQIFISPTLVLPVTVLATLVHELVHAVDRGEHGHKGPFAKMARALGLEGKMTATVAGEALTERLRGIGDALGEYPHAGLNFGLSPIKKQTTRMRKVICPACGYTLRTTAMWLAQGLPTCACGSDMEAA